MLHRVCEIVNFITWHLLLPFVPQKKIWLGYVNIVPCFRHQPLSEMGKSRLQAAYRTWQKLLSVHETAKISNFNRVTLYTNVFLNYTLIITWKRANGWWRRIKGCNTFPMHLIILSKVRTNIDQILLPVNMKNISGTYIFLMPYRLLLFLVEVLTIEPWSLQQ
jgi:hypothetical protein